MNIHEFQGKELFRSYGIPVADGKLACTPEEAYEAAKELGGDIVVVKAQIHAGGRGKAGGVKIAHNPDEAKQFATELIGATLVSKQTGPAGKLVRKVYIEAGTKIAKEFYLSMLIDNAAERICMIGSAAGGMEIEEVAEKDPDAMKKLYVDPRIGMQSYQLWLLADEMDIPADQKKTFVKIGMAMYKLFIEKNCSLIEINPLAITEDGQLIALDSKVNFDSSGLFRHPDMAALRDRDEEDQLESRATDMAMNFVSLDGTIGVLTIGAGLGMATMDAIKYFGGAPANFMDCGGHASADEVEKAFDLILSEKHLEGVLINIFGGITQCDQVALGVIASIKKNKPNIPIVVRLEGTNGDIANKLLKESGLNLEVASSLTEGATKIIALSQAKEDK